MRFWMERLWETAGAGAILFSGVVLSVRLRFVQIRKGPAAWKNAFSRDRDQTGQGAISPVQAVCTALAGTMGTGNIAGVAGAIALGGPGAVLWMWLAAFFGMATKYLETALAVRWRRRNARGEWVGGAMYVLEEVAGRKGRGIAAAFCVCGVLASFGIGNAAQVNTLSGSLCALMQAFGWAGRPGLMKLAAGMVLAAVTALMLLGGMQRIARGAERLLPFVGTVYVLCMLAVIISRADRILPALLQICTAAFAPEAVLGGAAGITVQKAAVVGVTRGVFTNEAGMGSSAIAHAAAHGATPQRQGLWAIFEVFVDTFLICTLTALGILVSGCEIPYGQAAGAEVTVQAVGTVFGARMSSLLITLCMACFALSTLMAWSFYGLRCMAYIGGGRGEKIYLAAFALLTVPFSVMEAGRMWKMAEVFTVLMALCNLPSLWIGSRKCAETEKKGG